MWVRRVCFITRENFLPAHLTGSLKHCSRWSCFFGDAYFWRRNPWKRCSKFPVGTLWRGAIGFTKNVQRVWLVGAQGGLRRVPLDTRGHGFSQMWNNNTHQFGGSGNVVLRSAEWALGFPCWLRSGAFTGHPYCRFSIVASPQTRTASRESVVSVYGDETPSPLLPLLGWLTEQISSGFER